MRLKYARRLQLRIAQAAELALRQQAALPARPGLAGLPGQFWQDFCLRCTQYLDSPLHGLARIRDARRGQRRPRLQMLGLYLGCGALGLAALLFLLEYSGLIRTGYHWAFWLFSLCMYPPLLLWLSEALLDSAGEASAFLARRAGSDSARGPGRLWLDSGLALAPLGAHELLLPLLWRGLRRCLAPMLALQLALLVQIALAQARDYRVFYGGASSWRDFAGQAELWRSLGALFLKAPGLLMLGLLLGGLALLIWLCLLLALGQADRRLASAAPVGLWLLQALLLARSAMLLQSDALTYISGAYHSGLFVGDYSFEAQLRDCLPGAIGVSALGLLILHTARLRPAARSALLLFGGLVLSLLCLEPLLQFLLAGFDSGVFLGRSEPQWLGLSVLPLLHYGAELYLYEANAEMHNLLSAIACWQLAGLLVLLPAAWSLARQALREAQGRI